MLFIRRCTAVVLWLLGWFSGIVSLQVALLMLLSIQWPLTRDSFMVAAVYFVVGLLFFLGGLAVVFAGQWLWRGDIRRRWSPPVLARNFYLFGSAIILTIICFRKLMGGYPATSDIYYPWFVAALLTALRRRKQTSTAPEPAIVSPWGS